MTATADDLLSAAAGVCAGQQLLAERSQARAACLLTRQALEQVVDALLAERRLGCPAAGMRVRLICLAQAYTGEPREVAYRAETAWRLLSSACHHHAYELSPSLGKPSPSSRRCGGSPDNERGYSGPGELPLVASGRPSSSASPFGTPPNIYGYGNSEEIVGRALKK